MKAPFSPFLNSLCSLDDELEDSGPRSFDYVSVLSTDSVGFRLSISQRSKSVSSTNMTTERGNVVRVYKDGQYSEYAFNDVPEETGALAASIREELDKQFAVLRLTGTKTYDTVCFPTNRSSLFVEKETDRLPEDERTWRLWSRP